MGPTTGWLLLAFTLGGLHAFDADHVVTVSTLASDREGRRAGLAAGLRWSIGHGVVLLLAGALLFALGQGLPERVVAGAERAVGIGMIALGAWVWRDLLRRRSHLHWHRHDGLPAHAHWHEHAPEGPHPGRDRHHHEHAATMVGALHGLAGSAPILALLPVAARSPAQGLAYLVVFGLGVALAMALVGGLLGDLSARLSGHADGRARRGLRAVSATGSIAIGLWLGLGLSFGS